MRKIPELECILLVDDDDATNFIHRAIIKQSEIDVHVDSVTDGQMALDYLTCQGEFSHIAVHPQPGIIFLDINMPGMNGWEFLKKYEALPFEQKAKIVVAMLTTSLNPDDKAKSEEILDIEHFYNKPLTVEMINYLVDQNFEAPVRQ